MTDQRMAFIFMTGNIMLQLRNKSSLWLAAARRIHDGDLFLQTPTKCVPRKPPVRRMNYFRRGVEVLSREELLTGPIFVHSVRHITSDN